MLRLGPEITATSGTLVDALEGLQQLAADF
jgi:hypothetical protein